MTPFNDGFPEDIDYFDTPAGDPRERFMDDPAVPEVEPPEDEPERGPDWRPQRRYEEYDDGDRAYDRMVDEALMDHDPAYFVAGD